MYDDERRMTIIWDTTPVELRHIAMLLEQPGCFSVQVNWFHTRLTFRYRAKKIGDPEVEIEGAKDGTIPVAAEGGDAE